MPALVALSLVLIACAPSWPPEPTEPRLSSVRLQVEPADPIEGEHLSALVPFEASGTCSMRFEVTTERAADHTRVVLVAKDENTCPIKEGPALGASLHELPPLAAGQYVLVAGGVERPFVIRPASTSPGPVPLSLRIALAVAEKYHPGNCFGEPGAEPGPEAWRTREPRVYHQMSAAHPDWTEKQVQRALDLTRSVEVRRAGSREYRYRFSDGRCCRIEEKIGTVRVREDGSFAIGRPHTTSSEDVPC